MVRPRYIEMPCKAALNKVSGMPFRWSLNPYRGCVHGCHYCYARTTHAYLGMNAGDEFTTRIVVKTNMPEVLRRELRRPTWQGERVAIGTATDAYQPCEGRYRLTRDCLEALREYDTPVSVVTKSTLVLRDRDVLAALALLPGTRVNFSITTLDPDLWRLIEPGTPAPLQRLAVMRRLVETGIPCGVYLAPILPGLTDDEDALDAVAEAARDHGATSFWAAPLRLAPLVKEHYLGVIAEVAPNLLTRYVRAYPGTNPPAGYVLAIERRVAQIKQRHGFAGDAMSDRRPAARPAAPADAASKRPGQLALPL
jgi:DNA repair photolyase